MEKKRKGKKKKFFLLKDPLQDIPYHHHQFGVPREHINRKRLQKYPIPSSPKMAFNPWRKTLTRSCNGKSHQKQSQPSISPSNGSDLCGYDSCFALQFSFFLLITISASKQRPALLKWRKEPRIRDLFMSRSKKIVPFFFDLWRSKRIRTEQKNLSFPNLVSPRSVENRVLSFKISGFDRKPIWIAEKIVKVGFFSALEISEKSENSGFGSSGWRFSYLV